MMTLFKRTRLSLIATALLLLCSIAVAQNHIKSDTTIIMQNFSVSVLNADSQIFSFEMTCDTSKLKPIDTNYYTMSNDMYREIKYRYLLDKQPQFLIVRSYNYGHRWLFFGLQLLYKKQP